MGEGGGVEGTEEDRTDGGRRRMLHGGSGRDRAGVPLKRQGGADEPQPVVYPQGAVAVSLSRRLPAVVSVRRRRFAQATKNRRLFSARRGSRFLRGPEIRSWQPGEGTRSPNSPSFFAPFSPKATKLVVAALQLEGSGLVSSGLQKRMVEI